MDGTFNFFAAALFGCHATVAKPAAGTGVAGSGAGRQPRYIFCEEFFMGTGIPVAKNQSNHDATVQTNCFDARGHHCRRRIRYDAGVTGRAALRPYFFQNRYGYLVARQVAPVSEFEVKPYKNQWAK